VTFLLLALSLAVTVWAIVLLPKARLVLLCTLVVVVGTFFGPEFFAIHGPLLLSVDRMLFFGVIALGTSLVLRGDLKIPKLSVPDYLVAAMVGWYFIRAITAGDAPPGGNPIGTWLFYVFLPAICYALVRVSNPSAGDIQTIISIMIGVGVYVAIIGFFEARGWYSLVFPRYIGDTNVAEFLGRARGPLMNPSANGIVLTISLSFAVLRGYYGTRAQMMIYGLLSLVILLGVYSTLTRGVWIGAVLAIVAMFWQSTPRWIKMLGMASAMVFGSLAVMGLKDQLLNMKRDKNLSAEDSAKSIELRPLLAVVAYEMFKDAPFVGHGFAVYLEACLPYFQNPAYDMPLGQAKGYFQHNIFLSSLVDTGIIGLTIYAWLLARLTRSAWRLGNHKRVDPIYRMIGLGFTGSMAGYFLGGMFQDVMLMPMIQLYLMLLSGIMISVYQRTFEVAIDDVSLQAAYMRGGDPDAPPMGRRSSDGPYSAGKRVGDGAFRPAT
jgi:O-antigen ligase